MIVLRDQVYSAPRGQRLTYDFFRPATSGPTPLLVFLHGGGWMTGDKSMYRDEALWWVPQGFACACIEYRLAPMNPFPAAVADAQAFVMHARSRSEELDIDPDAIVAFGNSSGGHLALMLGLCSFRFAEPGGPDHLADAVVSVCGITDLTDPRANHFPIAAEFLSQFIGFPYEEGEHLYRLASPLYHATSSAAPILMVHGTLDDIVPYDQAERMAGALDQVDAESTLVWLENEAHSFTYEGWSTIRQEALAFLKDTL